MDLVFSLYSCGLLYHCIDLSPVQKRIPGMHVNFQLSFCLFSLILIFHEKIGCYEPLKKSREILTRNQTYLVLKIACLYMTLPTERTTGRGRMWMDFLGHVHSLRFISLGLWLDNVVLDEVLFKSNVFFFSKKYCYLFFSKFSWNITMWRNLSSDCVLPVTSCGKELEVYTTAEKKKVCLRDCNAALLCFDLQKIY